MKKKTQITDISVAGYELSDTQLRRIAGGEPKNNRCTEPSASITNPGETDHAKDTIED